VQRRYPVVLIKADDLATRRSKDSDGDLAYVEERLRDITILMRVCYGDDSQVAIRADETSAALQRLKWELKRAQQKRQAAG